MKGQLNTKFGSIQRATILKVNNDGTCLVGVDELGLQQAPQKFIVPLLSSWTGPNGEFIGGFPARGTSVLLQQIIGGQWVIYCYLPVRGVFTDRNLMSALTPGRALMQVKNGNRVLIDPDTGIQVGDTQSYFHSDPKRDIVSYQFKQALEFTEAHRSITGVIKRDLVENSNRNVLYSTLTSHLYDDSLFEVGLDPTLKTNLTSNSDRIRNPPLVEKREVIYEHAYSYNILDDSSEASITQDSKSFPPVIDNGRFDSRANVLSLSQVFPNALIEKIEGTVVDSFGNVLDLNLSPLPLGKVDELSLKKTTNKSQAVIDLKAEARKGVGYYFGINTKKSGGINSDGSENAFVLDTNDTTDYARSRSKFEILVDKEGQTKINIPASSETGNVALLTRHENYSTLLAKQNGTDPKNLTRNELIQDIFLDGFSNVANIKLSGSQNLDDYSAPTDRVTNKFLGFGTAHHDIQKTCSTFLKSYTDDIIIFDAANLLNKVPKFDKLINDNVIVSGSNSNAGGRSLNMNLDGSLIANIGANTSDRQSVWLDCAGGMVNRIGRDKNGISFLSDMDGDMYIQLGNAAPDNDSRFADQNNTVRPATFDLRVLTGNGFMSVIRIDQTGVSISTGGRITMKSEQSITLETLSNLYLNAENIYMYANSGLPRLVQKNGVSV